VSRGCRTPLLFIAAYRLPGGVAATLSAAQPLIVATLIVVILRETPPWRLIAWGMVGVLGLGLIVLRASAQLDAIGVVAGLAGTASMALGIILAKHWGKPPEVSALGYAGWLLTAGGLFLSPITVLGLLSPVTAAVLGAIILGEVFTPVQLVGFTLALSAIVGGQMAGRQTK